MGRIKFKYELGIYCLVIFYNGESLMGKLIGFATYNVFFESNPEKIKEFSYENNVYLDYRIDPSYSRWRKRDGGLIQERMESPSGEEIKELLKEYDPAYQLIIYAPNDLVAQNLNNLIHGGRLLGYPSLFENPDITDIYNMEYMGFENVYKKIKYTEDIMFACLVAQEAWKNKDLIYSIEKYRFSLKLDSITPHSPAPQYGQIFSVEDRGYYYHVNAAYAILSAYSIIEELKLSISSSKENPRFIDAEGKKNWNPIVKNNILKKLHSIGILESDTIEWVIRGEYTKIYKEISPELGCNSRNYDGMVIFDKTFKIYEAIHYASYIRNFFIGHKFNEVVSSFNPYDVYNIQMLVRRLILSKLNIG